MMKNIQNLTFLNNVETPFGKKGRFGLFSCKCGNTCIKNTIHVAHDKVKSCGCYKSGTKSHGDSKTRLFRIFHKMRWRCYYPSNPWYSEYGGRGIKMAIDWDNNYLAFKEWSLNNGYHDKLTIDRIDNDKDYGPDNCRWISQKLQNINQRQRKDNKYGYTGVSPSQVKELPWKAIIKVNKIINYLGNFLTIEEAAAAYEKARKKREVLYLEQEKDLNSINSRTVAKLENGKKRDNSKYKKQ